MSSEMGPTQSKRRNQNHHDNKDENMGSEHDNAHFPEHKRRIRVHSSMEEFTKPLMSYTGGFLSRAVTSTKTQRANGLEYH